LTPGQLKDFHTWAPGAPALIDDKVIAARPGHPILQEALGMIPTRCGQTIPSFTVGAYLISAVVARLEISTPASKFITIFPNDGLVMTCPKMVKSDFQQCSVQSSTMFASLEQNAQQSSIRRSSFKQYSAKKTFPDINLGSIAGTAQECMQRCATDVACGGFFRATSDIHAISTCWLKQTRINLAETNLHNADPGMGYFKSADDVNQQGALSAITSLQPTNPQAAPFELEALWPGLVVSILPPIKRTLLPSDLESTAVPNRLENPLKLFSKRQLPKIVHLIWLGPQKVPAMVATWTKSFNEMHKDWIVYLWREHALSTLLMKNRGCFDRGSDYREKSDLARLEILNQFGGVFIDTDSIWLGRPLEPIIQAAGSTGFFTSFEPLQGSKEVHGFNDMEDLEQFRKWAPGAQAVTQNGVIGSTPGHPLLQKALSIIPERCSKDPGQPWATTGPWLLSFAIAELQREFGASRLVTILPHTSLFANFWHAQRLPSLEIVYDIARQCATSSAAITFQVGLSTNQRNSDYSERDNTQNAAPPGSTFSWKA